MQTRKALLFVILTFHWQNMILNCDLIKFLPVSQCASGIHRWNHPVPCLWKCSLPNIVLGCDSMKHLWPIRSQQALQVCCQPLRLHGIHKLFSKEEIASEMKANTNKHDNMPTAHKPIKICVYIVDKKHEASIIRLLFGVKKFSCSFVVVGNRQNIQKFSWSTVLIIYVCMTL